MSLRNKSLLGVTTFNAITAIVGGILLATGLMEPPIDYITNTAFNSYVVPGLVLAIFVGGSSLIASYMLIRRAPHAKDAAGLAGFIMMAWITAEVYVIRETSWLQLIFFIAGFVAVELAYPRTYGLFGELAKSDKD